MHRLSFLQYEYYGNPASAYIFAVATFLAILWGFLVLRRLARGGRTPLAADLMGQVRAPELIILALYVAERPLDLPARFEHALHAVTVLAWAYRATTLLTTAAGYAIRRTILSDPTDSANVDTAHTATLFAKAVIWTGAGLFVLSNLGFNVSSMLAGLGIGGIAVALAAQALLGDLFSAVAIYLDKPFVAGDEIKVADMIGTVEHIGVKTTRVRSLNGEMVVYPNSALTSARVQNFKPLTERRVLINFSVPLDTSVETLKKIPEQIRAIVTATPDTRFARAHMSAFQDSGLQFEAAFYVTSPSYVTYMDRQQAVFLALLAALRADGIPLAQPTRTIVVSGGKLG